MWNRSFIAICVLILVNQLGFGIIVPVMPAYARSFGLDASAVGLVIGIYGLARFVANVPAGQLAEARGRRTTLIVGCAITTAASILIATADTLPHLLAYRLLAGVGAATVITAGQIMVGDLSTPANRGRVMSTYQGFFLIGVGFGPAPGGFLADHFGLRAPFIAYAVFSALAGALALVLIRDTRPAARPAGARSNTETPESAAPDVPLRRVLTGAPFVYIGLVSFVQFFARTGAVFTVVPLLGKEQVGLSASQIGLAMTVVNVLNLGMLYHSGTFADRFGRKTVIVPATIVSGVSMALFAVSGSFAMFVAAALVWGLGSGIAGPAPGAYVADLSPPSLRGRVFGLYRSVADSGYVIGPPLLGWLVQATSYATPLIITAAMFVVSGVLFALFAPEFHRRTAPAALDPARRGA